MLNKKKNKIAEKVGVKITLLGNLHLKNSRLLWTMSTVNAGSSRK